MKSFASFLMGAFLVLFGWFAVATGIVTVNIPQGATIALPQPAPLALPSLPASIVDSGEAGGYAPPVILEPVQAQTAVESDGAEILGITAFPTAIPPAAAPANGVRPVAADGWAASWYEPLPSGEARVRLESPDGTVYYMPVTRLQSCMEAQTAGEYPIECPARASVLFNALQNVTNPFGGG